MNSTSGIPNILWTDLVSHSRRSRFPFPARLCAWLLITTVKRLPPTQIARTRAGPLSQAILGAM
jgi:hypothetical protein